MTTNSRQRGNIESQELRKNKLEWVVFAVSLLMVIGILGYLISRCFSSKPVSPDLQVSYVKDPTKHNPFRYKIMVENFGEETAEDVIIDASLLRGQSEAERSELQIMFVPRLAKREGWVNFTSNPANADSIAVRIMSYKKP